MTSKLDFLQKTFAVSAFNSRTVLFFMFALALISATARFASWMPAVFFGDDLSNLTMYQTGYFPDSLGEAFTIAFAEKYRPLFVWPMALMFGAFGDNLVAYQTVNVLLHALNATIVFAIAHRLSHGNTLVAVAVAVAAATSRFALYQVTQVTGFLEGIALAFFLLMTYCMVRAGNADQEAAWRWSWLALVMAFLVTNTHERYIVVAVWLSLALVVLPGVRALSRGRLFTLLGACVVIALFNVLVKVLGLGMAFFVGTGGTHMDLDVPRVLGLIREAVLSIFGFNEGPEYLVAIRAISLGWWPPVWLLAVAFTGAWFIAVGSGVRNVLAEKAATAALRLQRLSWPLLLLALGALMLAPPALTIRMEQRWVLEPFIITLLLFAWAAGVQQQRAIVPVWMSAVAIGLGTVISDTFIAAHFDQMFFVVSEQFAATVKRDIVDKDPGQATPVVLLASNDHCTWSLLDGHFFRVYGGIQRPVLCVGSIDEANSAGVQEDTPIYSLSTSPSRMIDIRSELLKLVPNGETVTNDFLVSFPEGSISDPREVTSPSGRGAMITPWDTFLGIRNSLTVVSGFSYSYHGVSIERDAYLRFGIAMTFPSQESTRASVRIEEEGAEPRVVYSQDLVPPRTGEKLQFEAIAIPLADFAGKTVSVTFSVETPPEKDSSGHWAAFSEPRIVIATTR